MNKSAFGWAAATMLAASAAFGQQDPLPADAPAVMPTEPVRVIEQPVSIGAAHKAKITLSIGEVAVLGEETDQIVVRTLIYCEKATRDLKRCEPDSRDLSLSVVTDGDRLAIDVKGISDAISRRLRVRQEVRVPSRLPIEVDVRSGDVRVDGMRADVRVSVRQGSVNLHLPASDVHQLELDAGSQIELLVGGQTIRGTSSVGNKLSWEVSGGTSQVRAGVAIGGLWVTLD